MRNVLFVKYNTLRRPEFQISTTIYEEHGERFVEKAPCTKEARAHVEGLERNCRLLTKAHVNVSVAEPNRNASILPFILAFFTLFASSLSALSSTSTTILQSG